MYLEREISQQPEVLRRILARESTNIEKIADELRRTGIRKFYLAARGSSDNAAIYAKYLFGIRNRMVTALAAPSLFTVYRRPPDLSGFALIAISQSGKGPDVTSVVNEAKNQGSLTIALTNNIKSRLANMSDFVINLSAGQELSIAATKTYTAQLFSLALLSHFLNPGKGGFDRLKEIPEAIDSVLESKTEMKNLAKRYRHMSQCVVLGRGFNYATAFELALKLKELCHVVAYPCSSVDFLHGPIAILEEAFPVILIAPKGVANRGFLGLLKKFRDRAAEILTISDDRRINSSATKKIELPFSTPEWLSPIVTIVAGQIFCLYLALSKGMDPDRPRGLTKVTKTF